jgi:hypothetical protein
MITRKKCLAQNINMRNKLKEMAEAKGKQFDLEDVLGVTTGVLLKEDGMQGIAKLLNYLTGEELYSHQLGRAANSARPHIFGQYPEMANVSPDIKQLKFASYRNSFLDNQEQKFGKRLTLTPMEMGQYQAKDPFQEFKEMIATM